MKSILLLLLSAATCVAQIDVREMTRAIYIAEGGPNTKYPYGIKSIKCSSAAEAERICRNTVVNNIKRWKQASEPKPFIEFLADRYCPIADDPLGHERWIKNVTKLYTKQTQGGK